MLNEQTLIRSTAVVPQLPALLRTKGGASFDPRSDVWSYRENHCTVAIDFSSLPPVSSEMQRGLKATLGWFAENRAADTLSNCFVRAQHLLRFLSSEKSGVIESIGSNDLLNYRASLDASRTWYVSSLAAFLKKWHALGYAGVDDAAIALLQHLRLKGNEKGVAVLTADPTHGPFTDLELEGIQAALNEAYANGSVSIEGYVLAWLFMLLGQRPVQYAALKVCDVSVAKDSQGIPTYLIRVPRAKQRNGTWRGDFKYRALIPQFGKRLVEYADDVKRRYGSLLSDPGQAPLFPSRSVYTALPGSEYHRTAADLGAFVRATFEQLVAPSIKNGRPLKIHALRFRRTFGTRAAAEGHGELIIAELLDHNDTQNVGVYVQATPAIVERIDRAIAMQMAPLAQAFAGVLIRDESQATRGSDPASRIVDARIDRSMKPMGSCGQYGFCGFLAPIACYTCAQFQPWLDGPHDAVLNHLLAERERLLGSTDSRIASINDRTILAVAEVVRQCDLIRKDPSQRNG